MGNDCSSILQGCADYQEEKSLSESKDDPIFYENQQTQNVDKRRMPLRKREQSYSEPVLESYEQKLQDGIIGVPQEFLKLYEFGELLGVGTTSKVYQIFHKRRKYVSHRKLFACKVIDKRKLTMGMMEEDIEPLLQQLRKEVDILRRINHPHVVAFQDFVETKRLLFIVTEYLPGGELFDYILKHGPLPEDLACKSIYGIFSAVAYLHDRGVIHRDIKAENVIFFHKVNGEVSLKLIDFGFSTILKHDLTGSFLGTGGYIAPEIRQNKQYSTSVDNWALGVLLYCTMSAKLPFSISLDALPADKNECSSHFKLRFPSKQWCGVSESCKDLITQLLNVDPFSRLTAKDSLNHVWFRPVRQNRKGRGKTSAPGSITSTPRSLDDDALVNNSLISNDPVRYYEVEKQHSDDEEEDGQTESEGSENGSERFHRRGKALRSLHSDLRAVYSLIQIERKHNTSRSGLLSPNSFASSQNIHLPATNHMHEVSNTNLDTASQQQTPQPTSYQAIKKESDGDYLIGEGYAGQLSQDGVPSQKEKTTTPPRVPLLWEGVSPITESETIIRTEALNDVSATHLEDSSIKTPRDIIHSKLIQDHTKLPSIRFVSQFNNNLVAHDQNESSVQFYVNGKANSQSSEIIGEPTLYTSTRYPTSAHDLASLPLTFWWQTAHRDSSFVAEEIHDSLAGVLFYYTYIPLNTALR